MFSIFPPPEISLPPISPPPLFREDIDKPPPPPADRKINYVVLDEIDFTNLFSFLEE